MKTHNRRLLFCKLCLLKGLLLRQQLSFSPLVLQWMMSHTLNTDPWLFIVHVDCKMSPINLS